MLLLVDFFSIVVQKKSCQQVVAELGHTRIPSCQLGQCSDQVEPDRVGRVLVVKRNFLKSMLSICKLWMAFYGSNSRFKVLHADGRTSQ